MASEDVREVPAAYISEVGQFVGREPTAFRSRFDVRDQSPVNVVHAGAGRREMDRMEFPGFWRSLWRTGMIGGHPARHCSGWEGWV